LTDCLERSSREHMVKAYCTHKVGERKKWEIKQGKKNTAARVAHARHTCIWFHVPCVLNQKDTTRRGDEGQARDRGGANVHMSAGGGHTRNTRKDIGEHDGA
jgi:hypothetical protein